jgi:spermidine/putrescine transport system permease protein
VAATASAADAGRRLRRRDRASTAALLSGPLLWLLLFFLAPVVYVALYSVGGIKIFPTDAGVWSVGDWKHLLVGGSVYMGLFWKSVRISLTVSAIVVLLAYPVGYFLALVVRKRKYILLLLIIAPFLTSYLLRVLAWEVILGDSGVINSFLSWIHLRGADQPVTWLLNSQFSVVLVLADLRFARQPRHLALGGGERSRCQPAPDVLADHAPAEHPRGDRRLRVRVRAHDR